MLHTLFLVFVIISLLGLAIGLYKPSIVIRWGEKKGRINVVITYGLCVILFSIGFYFSFKYHVQESFRPLRETLSEISLPTLDELGK